MRRAFVFSWIAIAAACVDLSGLNGGSPDAGGDASAPADVSVPDVVDADMPETGLPPDVDPEGGIKEAGTADVFVVEAGGNCCDCDLDTFLPNGADAACGGAVVRDCDDLVGAIHPDAGFALNKTWPSTHSPAFDWDCSGTVTKQLNHDLKCAQVGPGTCTGEGFQDDPPCGAEANYFVCATQGLMNCAPSYAGTRAQGCR